MSIKKHKIKLREVNRHLVCRLCRGYYIDATTIAECLHSFCRSCIIRYLEKNSFCPICEVQIHTAKPHLSLRQDKALQDVVYKLVPGLYHNEMRRRREFYAKHPEQIPAATPEQCGIEDRIIFSPDDSISLSLERLEREEYVFESISSRTTDDAVRDGPTLVIPPEMVLKKIGNKDQDLPQRPKRYLRCPAAVDISHLKKFIRMKYDLNDKTKIDIIHKRVSIPDHYTLMDVAYIYTWKWIGPMRFFYYYSDGRKEKPEAVPAEEHVKEEPKDTPVMLMNAEIKSEEPDERECELPEPEKEKVISEVTALPEPVVEKPTETAKTNAVPSDTEPKKEEKLEKTIANLLKSYRKDGEKSASESVSKSEAEVTIEITTEAKASEYDFESSSPPGKIVSLREFTKSEQSKNRKSENGWMSLQDFRKVMKENGEGEAEKPSKLRLVPCLKRIDENRKSPEKRKSPTIINIRTEDESLRKKEAPVKAEKTDGDGKLDENKKPDRSDEPAPKKLRVEEAMDLSGKEEQKKNDENMVEALVSAAQKQSIEPLLRVPQFLKNSGSPPKISPGRNISPSDISQALQFFKDLRSDIRVLEAKTAGQTEQFPPKISPYQQMYQQQMDLIKRLKRLDHPKKSPEKEEGKSPVDRALTQIQEQFELQNRMKQNLKNLPALLQFYNRPPFLYCPSTPTSKKPSLSPTVQKSPPTHPLSTTPASGSSIFPGFSGNSGLTSEMTFHQMFQNYLSQQEKMNQIKPSPLGLSSRPKTAPNHVTDFYSFGNETNRSPSKQKI